VQDATPAVAQVHDVHAADQPVQVEGFVVQDAGSLGVSGVIELETAVKGESVDVVAANPSSHGVSGLEDADIDTVDRQLPGCCQPGESSADDDDVMPRHRLGAFKSRANSGFDGGVLEVEAGGFQGGGNDSRRSEHLDGELAEQCADCEGGNRR